MFVLGQRNGDLHWFSEGKKNAYGVCKNTKTVSAVGDAKDLALKFKDSKAGTISGMIGKTAVATTTASSVASAASVTAVTHSSGALILTGSSGYVAGSLGSAGAAAVAGATTVTSIITAPATLIIGGAVAAGVGVLHTYVGIKWNKLNPLYFRWQYLYQNLKLRYCDPFWQRCN